MLAGCPDWGQSDRLVKPAIDALFDFVKRRAVGLFDLACFLDDSHNRSEFGHHVPVAKISAMVGAPVPPDEITRGLAVHEEPPYLTALTLLRLLGLTVLAPEVPHVRVPLEWLDDGPPRVVDAAELLTISVDTNRDRLRTFVPQPKVRCGLETVQSCLQNTLARAVRETQFFVADPASGVNPRSYWPDGGAGFIDAVSHPTACSPGRTPARNRQGTDRATGPW